MTTRWFVGLTCVLGMVGCGGGDDDDAKIDAGNVVVDSAVSTVDSAVSGTMVGPSGGTVSGPEGITLVVPAGALSTMTNITITEVATPPLASFGARTPIGKFYQFAPAGTQFATATTLTMPYDATLAGTASTTTFRITDMTTTPADLTPTTVNTTAKTVSAPAMHFTPLGPTRSCRAQGDSCGSSEDCCPGRGLSCTGSGEFKACNLAP